MTKNNWESVRDVIRENIGECEIVRSLNSDACQFLVNGKNIYFSGLELHTIPNKDYFISTLNRKLKIAT